jgi:hypothetical protein
VDEKENRPLWVGGGISLEHDICMELEASLAHRSHVMGLLAHIVLV